MTSNRPLEDWGKLIGDVPSATAILDRFLHHAEVLAFQGKSYRLRKQLSTPGADEPPNPANAPTGPTEDSAVKHKRQQRKNQAVNAEDACQV